MEKVNVHNQALNLPKANCLPGYITQAVADRSNVRLLVPSRQFSQQCEKSDMVSGSEGVGP